MKRLFTFLAALALVILCATLLPTEARAASTSDLTFKFNSDGKSYYVSDCKSSASGSLTIPVTYNGKPVTSIGNEAFRGCVRLTSIVIPDSVVSIGSYAFYNCYGLTSVTIGNSVTSIGDYAFRYCNSLTSITIPDSVINIRQYAFSGCTSLTSVTIGNSVTSIGDFAFSNCTNLTSITIPDSVINIRQYAFSGCAGLTSVTISDSVKTMGSAVFLHCNVTELIIADGSKTVTPTMVQCKSNLEKVVIPNSVTTIDNAAFLDCTGLTSVTIPNSVKTIGTTAFNGCTGLTNVTIPGGVTYIGSQAFADCTGLTSVTIPIGITSIRDYTFDGCTGLTSVTIPDSVTSIGREAFDNCTSLTSVTYCGTEEQWNQISICSYNTALTNAIRSYHNYVDATCTNPAICSVCGEIGQEAHGHNIADGICTICKRYGTCGTNLTWALDDAGTLAISGTGAMKNYAYGTAPWDSLEADIKKVVIGNAVTRIGAYAFSGLRFTSVTIGNSVKRIGDCAFWSCKGLTSVTVPDSVTYIGNCVFHSCWNLTSVTIPESVTFIGFEAFLYCSSLTNVTYCGTEEQWDQISIGSNNTKLTDATRGYHNWEGKATCTTQQVCTICGQKEDGHVWIDATCTSLKYCFLCGMTEGEYGHTWIAANCTNPKTCSSCGATEGTIQHTWNGATCTTAKTCSVCGTTEGKPLGHSWVAASCTVPKNCTTCGTTEGSVLGHSWVAATCTTPKTCSTCGRTEGSVQHKWVAATCTTPKTCSICSTTEGAALGHSWQNATCQKPKHCTICGVTEGAITEHAYSGDSDAFCNVCNHQRIVSAPSLKFYGAAGLSFQEYIGIQILAKNELLANYDKAYVVIVQETPDGDVESTSYGRLYASKYTIFEQKIVSWSMTEQVTMTLYAEKNGVIYRGASITTSVKQLAMDKLATYKAQDNTKACRALVDMLNYGAAVQTTYNHNAENLPTADLGEYASYGTTEGPALNAANDIMGTGSVKVYVNNISLQDKVEFQLLVKTTELNNRTVLATLADAPVDVEYKVYNSNYTIICVAVAAAHMRDTYSIALCDTDGNAVTQVYNVSVEAYAKEQLSGDRGPALIAMMKYGDSVAALL